MSSSATSSQTGDGRDGEGIVIRTKKAAVDLALQEFIARREQIKILDLVGELEWDDSFDYKVERSRG